MITYSFSSSSPPIFCIDQFNYDNFLCAVMDAVHAAHPLKLVRSFQGFGHALPRRHSGADALHAFVADLVYLYKVLA